MMNLIRLTDKIIAFYSYDKHTISSWMEVNSPGRRGTVGVLTDNLHFTIGWF